MLTRPKFKNLINSIEKPMNKTDPIAELYICNLIFPTPLMNILNIPPKDLVIKYTNSAKDSAKGITILSPTQNL